MEAEAMWGPTLDGKANVQRVTSVCWSAGIWHRKVPVDSGFMDDLVPLIEKRLLPPWSGIGQEHLLNWGTDLTTFS